MSRHPDAQDRLFVRSLLTDAGIEETPELVEQLLELRRASRPAVPEPSGKLAALFEGAPALLRPRSRRGRGIILGAALVGAMAVGAGGVAANSDFMVQADPSDSAIVVPKEPAPDPAAPDVAVPEQPEEPAVPAVVVDPEPAPESASITDALPDPAPESEPEPGQEPEPEPEPEEVEVPAVAVEPGGAPLPVPGAGNGRGRGGDPQPGHGRPDDWGPGSHRVEDSRRAGVDPSDGRGAAHRDAGRGPFPKDSHDGHGRGR